MSALASLVRAYDRLYTRSEVPAFGFSQEKIGFLISLRDDGTAAGSPIDLRSGEGKKRQPRTMAVPASFKRPGVTPRAFFLWDNTAFALGITASEGKDGTSRLEAFRRRHLQELSDTSDVGLLAFRRFVEAWRPEHFAELGWPEDMKDQNVVFGLESERIGPGGSMVCIHDRPAARELWAKVSGEADRTEAVCLVSGVRGPIARLHPSIKGVWGAQTAGASIVSFNLDAFTSYGHEQGDNAPVSEAAAFAYTTALNHFLARDSGHRVQIGDASTVFWADASAAEAAGEAEDVFAGLMQPDETVEAGKVGAILEAIRQGLPIETVRPLLPPDVRFFVLGLAPNAARLSIRFYLEDDFGEIAKRWLEHVGRLRLDPPPKDPIPPMWRLLVETAPQRKSENVIPNLAGEWMRAILTGAPYPLSLIAILLGRLRADHDVNAHRVAIIKSVLLSHDPKREVPVSLDPNSIEPGYLLGRLFAMLEQIQAAALGRSLNATIKDKFYGAASAQPRKVFPQLLKGAQPHLSKVGKDKPGYRVNLERQVAELMEMMSPDGDPFPAHLPDRQQGLFALGYYHQRSSFFKSAAESPTAETPALEPA
ncbi:type I-C CRISPR-associated protein Cas8c/Csd1 [Prosthecomicrobium sp. N25]|uniref:type I-C CRISPR-associated protein Cas8c/Csd1 n=1 Tax=Prosthecomicrobium sp. N25 TaxID=3129254 RepID=UPI0030787425